MQYLLRVDIVNAKSSRVPSIAYIMLPIAR
jgi:hypothetical protein